MSVHDAQLVAVLHGVRELAEPAAATHLVDVALAANDVQEAPVGRVLHDDVHPVRRFDGLQEAHDVRVAQPLHHLDLAGQELDQVVGRRLELGHDLDGHVAVVVPRLRDLDGGVGAGTDGVPDGVAVALQHRRLPGLGPHRHRRRVRDRGGPVFDVPALSPADGRLGLHHRRGLHGPGDVLPVRGHPGGFPAVGSSGRRQAGRDLRRVHVRVVA